MFFELSGVFRRCSALLLLVVAVSTLSVSAITTPVSAASGINQQLNFQGRLMNAQGAIVPDGNYNMQFQIYQDGTGTVAGNPSGTLEWTESWLNSAGNGVTVRNGYISVHLGSITPFGNSVDWNQDTLWLSMNIGSTNSSCTPFSSCAPDGEMVPMKRLSAVPYALNAGKLGGLDASGFIQNTSLQQSGNFNINGTGTVGTLQASTIDTASAGTLTIGSANTTNITLGKNVTVAAGMSLTLAGGTTGTRPASPTEGMMWFDTTTKQLLVYSNGKWQADRNTATKVVAASNASQALKDAADYVATGTGDQGVINTALTAAAGGKVYLTEGTFTVNASVSIPNNTTLAGAGAGTVITLPNSFNAAIGVVVNTNTAAGTGIVVQDLRIDGNKINQTVGSQTGISFDTVTDSTITNITAQNMRTDAVYVTDTSSSVKISNNILSNNGSAGLFLDQTTYYATITGNIVRSNGWTGFYGRQFESSTVSGNSFEANTGSGVTVENSIDNTFSANTIGDNGDSGFVLTNSNSTTVSNNAFHDNGGSANNNAIYLNASDNNTITGNNITDGSPTTNYAINISNSTSDKNYLADNRFSSTLGTSTINDLGTGTIYANQSRGENGTKLTNRTANDAEAFSVQTTAGANVLAVNTTNSSVLVAGALDTTSATTLSLGTATASGITIGRGGVTTTIQGSTSIVAQASTSTSLLCTNSGIISTCDASVLAPTAVNFIQNTVTLQSANIAVRSAAAGNVAALIQGAASQTANILEVRTGAGNPGLIVSSTGAVGIGNAPAGGYALDVTGDINSSTQIRLGGTSTLTNTSLSFSGASANQIVGSNNQSLAVRGGNATLTNTNGGNLTLSGGTGNGTGVSGLVVINNAAYSTAGTQTSATSVNITQANIDSFGALILSATGSAVNYTLTSPTLGASAAGRVIYVTAANGSQDFTLRANVGGGTGVEQNIAMRQNTTATMIWNGSQWTAAGASSSTTLQSAYDNTLQSAGGAELVVSKTSATNGLTIRDSATNSVNGTLLSVQTSSAAGLLSVNSNVTEYASNAGAEVAGGTPTTFPASTWTGLTGATVTRYNTANNNIATGQGSVSILTTAVANTGVKNQLVNSAGAATALTANTTYNVSFTTRLASGSATFTDMNVWYSADGSTQNTACTLSATATMSVWTKVNCTFTTPTSGIAAANAIFIRQTAATARTFYVDNLSVTIAADYNFATDGSVGDAANFSTNWSYTTGIGAGTPSHSTGDGYDASNSAQVQVTTGAANAGIRNRLRSNPLPSTLYRITVYAKATAAFADFKIRYSPDNGTTYKDCDDYNTQTLTTTTWTKVTCYITTPATAVSNPYVYFVESSAAAQTFMVDAFSMTLRTVTTPNVQVGGGVNGGPTTLFTLDKGASAPIASDNDALLGSMYYDTTLGKLQCYEADGWGACGSSPDTVVTISPEYNNAVMHGTGVGTMTSDICSDTLNINDGSSSQPTICGANETYNFYKWTSPQASPQTYGIYVTYQLPSTFKEFASGQTNLMGRTNSANASVTYQIFRSDDSGLTACSAAVSVSSGVQTTWQTKVASGAADPSTCSFEPGDSIVFKIEMTASGTANAYVGNLNFIFSNR